MNYNSVFCILFFSAVSIALDGNCNVEDPKHVMRLTIHLAMGEYVLIQHGIDGWKIDSAMDNCLLRDEPYAVICFYAPH